MEDKEYARQLLATMLGSVQMYRHEGDARVIMYAVTTRHGVDIEINEVFHETEVQLPTRSERLEEVVRSCWCAAQFLAAEGRKYTAEPLAFAYADELRAEADAFFAQPIAA